MKTFLFYFIISITIYLAIGVITVDNPITSLLCLISCFILTSLLICLLEYTFLALIFIAIYIGAIAIFFLLVVMIINISYDETKYFYLKQILLVNIIFFFLYFLQQYLTISQVVAINTQPISLISLLFVYQNSLQVFGFFLYTFGKFFVIYAGFLLFIAMIGVILIILFQDN